MSLSDCSECWETPCVCGHMYKDYSEEKLVKLMRTMVSKLDPDVKSRILYRLYYDE